jgi:hypothetical protein
LASVDVTHLTAAATCGSSMEISAKRCSVTLTTRSNPCNKKTRRRKIPGALLEKVFEDLF